MSLRTYIIILAGITALCIAAFIITLEFVNPTNAGVFGLILFYMSFGLSVIGIAALAGLYARIIFSNNEILFAHIGPSFRQGVLIALTATIILLLQGFRLLKWWDALLVVVIISMTEFFFHSKELQKQRIRGRRPPSETSQETIEAQAK